MSAWGPARCKVCRTPNHLHGPVCQHCRSHHRAATGQACPLTCVQCGTRLRHEPPDPARPVCGFCAVEQEQAA